MLTQYPGVHQRPIWVLDRISPELTGSPGCGHRHPRADPRQERPHPARIGAFLPDGSYYSYLTGAGGRWCLKVRVIEYHVTVAARTCRRCSA